jgi:hypothetical protein
MESITLSLGLIPIFLLGVVFVMIFIYADAKEQLIMLGSLIVIGISIAIVTSDIMQNFILYLRDIGFIGSVYWYVVALPQPLIVLLLKPLMNSMRKKSVLVRIITAGMFLLMFWIIILIVVGNVYFGLSKL